MNSFSFLIEMSGFFKGELQKDSYLQLFGKRNIFAVLKTRFNLGEFEHFCLLLACAAEIDSAASDKYPPTFESALSAYLTLFELSRESYEAHGAFKAFLSGKPLSFLLTFNAEGRFRLKEDVFRYILGDLPLERISTGNFIKPAFGMSDLVLDAKTMSLLTLIRYTLTLRPRLYNDYGYGKLFLYGRGIGVLFHGASGTGKTMAVQALASELGLNIMKADISQIVDKYIGETEKRLSEIFESAAQSECILFFDEADSLFAQRTEVSDSRDRSANSQTAHLLQKMEEFDGAVVLATNLIDNIDDAFKRRLPFIVEFKRPDAALRKIMWRKFIPGKMPLDERGIDFDFLGEVFELTPAVIKWAAFSAAVRAVAEGGSVLCMEHIFAALRYEYEKTGAAFPEIEQDEIVL
ncbi:MAG: ATP-binding protein [Oscillospiraceae bacterium]|nr:ATP-binding protein [Oscillospiraceae bacterium]